MKAGDLVLLTFPYVADEVGLFIRKESKTKGDRRVSVWWCGGVYSLPADQVKPYAHTTRSNRGSE